MSFPSSETKGEAVGLVLVIDTERVRGVLAGEEKLRRSVTNRRGKGVGAAAAHREEVVGGSGRQEDDDGVEEELGPCFRSREEAGTERRLGEVSAVLVASRR